MRIVSICPSNTELLSYLDLTSSIVGIDNYSDWPPAVNRLPRLGSDLDIDMEAVERLKPDLVVASLSVPGMEKNIERLKERSLPYIVSNPKNLQEIGDTLVELGHATGRQKRAEVVYRAYINVIEKYRKISDRIEERPSLYWEWWAKPVYTPGGGNWLSDISGLAGARNAFGDNDDAKVRTDWEDVKRRDPDHICLVWVGIKKEMVKPQLVEQRPGWSEIKAIRNNRLHVLDEPLFCRPSPRLITGLAKIAHIVHPELYPVYEDGKDAVLEML
jgi:iron complex transport system substrate-binding protein